MQSDLIGIGLYTIPEASRLTGIDGASIRRWMYGYRSRQDGEIRLHEPLWEPQLDEIDGISAIGFLDLMEIRFVQTFRRHGVSLQAIRAAARRACDLFRHDHPFSRKRFKTDGRSIFAEIARETEEPLLLNLVRNQYAFRSIVAPALYAGLEYSDGEEVARWFPMHPNHQVMLDPRFAFGRPIVKDGTVPTDVLAEAVRVEGSIDAVARWYDIPKKAVGAAVEYEKRLAA